jgi:hypothetical protein
VSALAREAATRPVYVSSSAFVFPEGQARFLGANGQAVWAALQRCCRLEEVLRTRGLPADETIYRLRPR